MKDKTNVIETILNESTNLEINSKTRLNTDLTFVAFKSKNNVMENKIESRQGRSEGTSSVAFKILIMNCQIYFISLFIFNCLTLNINVLIFNLFDVPFLFSENNIFCKQKRTAVYGRSSLV